MKHKPNRFFMHGLLVPAASHVTNWKETELLYLKNLVLPSILVFPEEVMFLTKPLV